MGLYTSPFYFSFALRKLEGYRQNPRSLGDICMYISLLYAAGYILRTFGRMGNPVFMEFNQVLRASTRNGEFNTSNKAALSKYDFDFWAWPVEFQVQNLTG